MIMIIQRIISPSIVKFRLKDLTTQKACGSYIQSISISGSGLMKPGKPLKFHALNQFALSEFLPFRFYRYYVNWILLLTCKSPLCSWKLFDCLLRCRHLDIFSYIIRSFPICIHCCIVPGFQILFSFRVRFPIFPQDAFWYYFPVT